MAKEELSATGGSAHQSRGSATSDAILRAGLRLIAESGYSAVSIRRICQEAGVNLALMNYHFGSKAQLLEAIFRRWGGGVNSARVRLLNELEARHVDGLIPIDELLDAYISPSLKASHTDLEDELHFIRLSGRVATDPAPEVMEAISAAYDEAGATFIRLLRKACSHLTTEEFLWRFVFLIGAMVYTRAETGRVESLASKIGFPARKTSVHNASKYLIPFLTAGLNAPSVDKHVRRPERADKRNYR